MYSARNIAVVFSGVLGFCVSTYFAWTIYIDGIPQNVATWFMIFLLDIIGVVLVFKDGNRKPYLQIGWTIAAACIVAAIISSSPWRWGDAETVSLILCIISILLWVSLNARLAIWAYMVAMYVSCLPLIIDYWNFPQRETLWVWLWSIGACVLAIYGAPKRDFANIFVPWSAIILNGIIAILCAL